VLKKYGRNVGINVHGVRSFGQQMLVSLRHMKNCGYNLSTKPYTQTLHPEP